MCAYAFLCFPVCSKFNLFPVWYTFGCLFLHRFPKLVAVCTCSVYCLELINFEIGYSGTCQGVIALNTEDGTLHRFRAASTILATGVMYFFSACWGMCF